MTTRLRTASAATILLAICGTAWAVQEAVIRNAGIARVITDLGGPLRTNRIEANGVQLLQYPGTEFVIDLDYKGQVVSLVPGDFEVKGVETIKDGALWWDSTIDDLPSKVHYSGTNACFIDGHAAYLTYDELVKRRDSREWDPTLVK